MIANSERNVYVALDLGDGRWDIGVWADDMANPSVWQYTGTGYDHATKLHALAKRLEAVLANYGPDVTLCCCYEASWLGFWLSRWLEARSVKNLVIAPSSIEVVPKKKRRKTDKLDVRKLVRKLKQYVEGDRRAFSPVRVPTLQEEAVRERQREREHLKGLVQEHRAWLGSKLAYYGIPVPQRPKDAGGWQALVDELPGMTTYTGDAIPLTVVAAMGRTVKRLALTERELSEVEAEIRTYHRGLPEDSAPKKLAGLRGFGVTSSQQLCAEIMDWTRFRNRKQPGAFAGLCPTPWNSCTMTREQGIGKDGNPRIRATMVEAAWLWVRWQPTSALTQKWQDRLAQKGRRRRMAIVGLARELLVLLWRYLTQDVPLEGAVVKTETVSVRK